MRPFEQAWGLVKGFRHKFGPVTHFHGVRSVESETPTDENYMEIGRDPNQHREVIDSIRSKGLIPSKLHGAVFMAPLLEAHNYAGGGPLFGIRTEGLDLEEGHMVDAHQQPHTIVRDTIDPERLVLISPNTYHENVDYRARLHPESEDYIEPRNLPDGGLIDSFGRPRLTLKAMRQTELGEHHPDFPSSHGPVIYVHGTANYNYPSIREKGLIANDYPYNGYYGNFVSTNPEVKDWYGRNRDWRRPNRSSEPMLIGVRAGAGTPQPYFGYENDEEERIFANHWRFPNNIDPKYLVNMGDEVPKVLPDFYVDGKPPDFPEGLSGFDLDAWEKKWGKQT